LILGIVALPVSKKGPKGAKIGVFAYLDLEHWLNFDGVSFVMFLTKFPI